MKRSFSFGLFTLLFLNVLFFSVFSNKAFALSESVSGLEFNIDDPNSYKEFRLKSISGNAIGLIKKDDPTNVLLAFKKTANNPYPNKEADKMNIQNPWSNNNSVYVSTKTVEDSRWNVGSTHLAIEIEGESKIAHYWKYGGMGVIGNLLGGNAWSILAQEDVIKTSHWMLWFNNQYQAPIDAEPIPYQIVFTGKIFPQNEPRNKDAFLTTKIQLSSKIDSSMNIKRGIEERTDGKWRYNTFTISDYSIYYDIEYFLKAKSDYYGNLNCSTFKDEPDLNPLEVCGIQYNGTVTFKIIKGATEDKDKIVIIRNKKDSNEQESNGLFIKTITEDKGLNIDITEVLNSPLLTAMENSISMFVSFINTSSEYLASRVGNVLLKGNNVTENTDIEQSWTKLRNIAISLLMIAIIIIAFTNTLSIDIEKYGLQRMLPKLIIGVVMTYFSFLISAFLLEFATALQLQLLSIFAQQGMEPINFRMDIDGLSDIVSMIGIILLLIVVLIALILMLLYLYLILIIRVVILGFLVVISPLAFIFSILPLTENLYKRWWSEFTKWVFIGPAVLIFLVVGSILINSSIKASDTSSCYDKNGNYYYVSVMNKECDKDPLDTIYVILTAAIAYGAAAAIPNMMGGQILGGVMKGLNQVKGRIPGYKMGQEFIKQRKALGERKRGERVQRARTWLGTGRLGRLASGMDRNEYQKLISSRKKDVIDNVLPRMNVGDQRAFALGTYRGDREIEALQRDRLNQEAMGMHLGDTGGMNDAVYTRWGQQYGQTKAMNEKRPHLTVGYDPAALDFGGYTGESFNNINEDFWNRYDGTGGTMGYHEINDISESAIRSAFSARNGKIGRTQREGILNTLRRADAGGHLDPTRQALYHELIGALPAGAVRNPDLVRVGAGAGALDAIDGVARHTIL